MGNATPLLSGCKILLVEDDSDTRQMMKFVFEQSGASVAAADCVPAALEAFRFRVPDVLVADIGMPGLNGYALIAEIRKLDVEQQVHIPAVAVTAFSSPQDKARALDAGFERYVPKPFDPLELIQAVSELRGHSD
jgi:CheY-like chemotaxis protein